MCLTVYNGSWLSLTVSPVPWSCYLSLTVFHCCWLSLTVSPIEWSCCKSLTLSSIPCSRNMSLTVTYCCWLCLTVSSRAMELLHVSHCLLWFMGLSQCLFSPTVFYRVSHCLLLLPAVSHCLSGPKELLHVSQLTPIDACCLSLSLWSLRVATCLSLSPMVADCLPLSLPVPWRFLMSLSVSYSCLLSLTASPVPRSSYISHCLTFLLAVFHYLFWFHGIAERLSLSPTVACCLSTPWHCEGY